MNRRTLMAFMAAAMSPACGGRTSCFSQKAHPTLFTREIGQPITDRGVEAKWTASARYLGAQPDGNYRGISDRVKLEWGDGYYYSHIFTDQYQEIRGGGPQTVFELTYRNKPKRLTEFSVEFDAAVKSYSGSADAVGQLVFFTYLVHPITKKYQINLFALFDNRYDYYQPFVGNDTYIDFESAPMQVHFPQKMEKIPYKKSYFMNFTEEKMKELKWDMEYEIVLMGFLHETFISPNNSNVDMEVEVTNLIVSC